MKWLAIAGLVLLSGCSHPVEPGNPMWLLIPVIVGVVAGAVMGLDMKDKS